jgi:hypothetical protein
MHPTVADRLLMRERARGIGDVGLESACNADLSRLGYREEIDAAVDAVMETAVPDLELERAVPEKPRRGGRPKLPRCEHNNIVGRCAACDEEEEQDVI